MDREKERSNVRMPRFIHEQFERAKTKFIDPVASVNRSHCAGCHGKLPAMALGLLRRDGFIICELCGRVLRANNSLTF